MCPKNADAPAICANLFSNPTMHNKVLGLTPTGLHLEIWFLFPTHRLVMMIICANLFSNPTMHNKVMGLTGFTEVYAQSLSADCDLDL